MLGACDLLWAARGSTALISFIGCWQRVGMGSNGVPTLRFAEPAREHAARASTARPNRRNAWLTPPAVSKHPGPSDTSAAGADGVWIVPAVAAGAKGGPASAVCVRVRPLSLELRLFASALAHAVLCCLLSSAATLLLAPSDFLCSTGARVGTHFGGMSSAEPLTRASELGGNKPHSTHIDDQPPPQQERAASPRFPARPDSTRTADVLAAALRAALTSSSHHDHAPSPAR